MISLLLIVFAAAYNAIMDNIKDHWYESIFNKQIAQWWDPAISWKNKYNHKHWYLVQLTDAWHLFKMLMIVSLIGAVVLYRPLFHLPNWCSFIIYGIAWNGTFDLFYNVILNKKK